MVSESEPGCSSGAGMTEGSVAFDAALAMAPDMGNPAEKSRKDSRITREMRWCEVGESNMSLSSPYCNEERRRGRDLQIILLRVRRIRRGSRRLIGRGCAADAFASGAVGGMWGQGECVAAA